VPGLPDGIPISGVAGDQQAALYGQDCVIPGDVKCTYGTGAFLLMNVGHDPTPSRRGLLSTVAWTLEAGGGGEAETAYALEGSTFIAGALVQWLRDGLGIIDQAAELGPLAATVDSSDGVFMVPAFTGLGSPWWDPYARGTIVGLTRGTTRAHLARAVVDAMALQTRDVVDAMSARSGHDVRQLTVDGGASVMDLLLQIQADQLGVPVRRTKVVDTTALGAAFLAGLAEGVWDGLDDVRDAWSADHEAVPEQSREAADATHATWLKAIDRARSWDES
jgi:glycerol kinase